MISEETQEKLVKMLLDRIEKGNEEILKAIGESIKKIGKLTPSKARQVAQILKYGGDFNKIINKLQQITDLNEKEIYKIFEEEAKINQMWAEKFYQAKNVSFLPYDQNIALKRQVMSLAKITADTYKNISNTTAIGFTIKDIFGNEIFKDISETYAYAIDKAVLSISQGKTTFESEMGKVIKELGDSGVKTIDYASGRTMRLDSAVRMNMLGALRDLSNENQKSFGEEFGADGVEISVHMNPAPDHAEVQGRQFSNEEFEKFQNDQDAVDYTGKLFTASFDGHDRRSISEYNCYHYIFSIVLGVSEPLYNDEQLKEIINNNEKGFEFEGKHYSMYEGTQMQRQIETKIRSLKEKQVLARASGFNNIAEESQNTINILSKKYNDLSKASGLRTEKERLKVSGYRKTKINKTVSELKLDNIDNISKFVNSNKEDFKNLDVKELQLKINEKYHFNDKPTLLSENDFDRLEEIDNYNKPGKLEEKDKYIKVFRGWGDKKYSEEYKYGKNSYGEGGFVDGVGTYATDNEPNAWAFANEEKDKFMEIAIPNSAKFITKEDLVNLHFKIYEEYNNKRDVILKKYGKDVVDILDVMNENISSTAVLNKYDITVNHQYRNWIILNRSKIIIKK